MNTKYITITLLVALATAALLITPVAAATITDATLTNVNVYAGTNLYNIAPEDYYDDTVTTTGIINIPNRYIYGVLHTTPAKGLIDREITIDIINRQGANILQDTIGTKIPQIEYTYEPGQTGTASTHTYTTPGTKTITATLQNPGQTYTLTHTLPVYSSIKPEITAVTITTPTPAVINTPITIIAEATSPMDEPLTYQWYVTQKDGISNWQQIPGATASTLTYTPQQIGYHQFKVTVTGTYGTTDSETTQTDVTALVYNPQAITNTLTAFDEIGKFFLDIFQTLADLFISSPFVLFLAIAILVSITTLIIQYLYNRKTTTRKTTRPARTYRRSPRKKL